jgi:hypothetical protein
MVDFIGCCQEAPPLQIRRLYAGAVSSCTDECYALTLVADALYGQPGYHSIVNNHLCRYYTNLKSKINQ